MTSTFRMTLYQNNDETIDLPFTSEDAVYPLTAPGLEVDFFIKTSQATPDSDPSTIKLSTVTGDIVVSDGPDGVATLTLSHTHLQTPGLFWWRCDAVIQGSRKTAGYGPLQIQAM
jgi:hypothetical protein